ncbi:hypothetical protein ACROYT_G036144 [Oculina patagonica]
MKAFSPLVVALTVCFAVCSYFLPITTSEPAASLKQQGQQQAFNLWHRIKRDVSSKPSPTNKTLVQNVTTTGIPTIATTYRRPFFGWPTRRRNTPRPFGSALNLTGLTEVQIEKLLRGNRTAPPLDHLGFPKIPNSHRGTRRPPTGTKHNASKHTQTSGKGGDGSFPTEIMGELRKRENKTQTSTFHSNAATSTKSVELSSKVPHTEGARKESRNDNGRNISLVIAKHSIWISVVVSLLLSAFICLMVHWVRRRRRGKLVVAPAGKKGQRSAAVVFKA